MEIQNYKFHLGSKSKIKTNVIQKFTGNVINYDVSSEIPEQPIGLKQGIQGCKNRIKNTITGIMKENSLFVSTGIMKENSLFVSIENVIYKENNKWYDVGIVMIQGVYGTVYRYSDRIQIPDIYIDINQNETYAYRMKKDYPDMNVKDPHSVLGNKISRDELLSITFLETFNQYISCS